jgi:hypothetical protein
MESNIRAAALVGWRSRLNKRQDGEVLRWPAGDMVAAMLTNRMYRLAMACLLAGAIGSVLAAPATAKKKRVITPPACRTNILEETEPEPVELAGAPEAVALDQFGVLRRAAGPADQLPPLSRVGVEVDSELSSYYPGYIRQLVQLPSGSRYFLIPGFKRTIHLPPEQCLPKQLRHLRRPHSEPVYCVAGISVDVRQGTDVNCQTLAEIEAGSALAKPLIASSFQVDLVPDGVATVRLVYRGGTAIAAPVSENAFMFTPPPALISRAKAMFKHFERFLELERKHAHKRLSQRQRRRRSRAAIKLLERVFDELPPKQVQWLNAGGQVVRSFKPRRDPRTGLIIATGGGVSGTGVVPIG